MEDTWPDPPRMEEEVSPMPEEEASEEEEEKDASEEEESTPKSTNDVSASPNPSSLDKTSASPAMEEIWPETPRMKEEASPMLEEDASEEEASTPKSTREVSASPNPSSFDRVSPRPGLAMEDTCPAPSNNEESGPKSTLW
jgi:hypothetical protein